MFLNTIKKSKVSFLSVFTYAGTILVGLQIKSDVFHAIK